jgi:hypothetical protein
LATLTDPAREIADFCKSIPNGATKTGDRHLADVFGVEAWSREYLEILSTFMDRTDFLIQIISELSLDADQLHEAQSHVKALQKICTKDVLVKRWDDTSGGLKIINSPHTSAVSALSGLVRQRVQYPKLDEKEIADVLSQIDQLLTWLDQHQLGDQDFIRHALILGLRTFRTRLSRVGWLGWDCAYEGLREVVAAYMALERGVPVPSDNTSAAAALMMTGKLLKGVWDKAGRINDGLDKLDVPVRLYALYSGARDMGVVGLITGG